MSGESFLTPPGPLSDLVARAVEAETGVRPVLSTSGGTSDARFVKDHCPVVEFGLVGQTDAPGGRARGGGADPCARPSLWARATGVVRVSGGPGARVPPAGARGRSPPFLLVMVKEPHPGCVKTRLARDIGPVAAAWWFRHQSLVLLRRLRDPRWRLVLAVSPDAEGMASRVWPRGLARVPQGRGDLGDRMGRLLRGMPPGPACIVGADVPGVDRARVAEAFRALGRADAVLGPATDGGYWLVGLRRTAAVPAGLFRGVRWSSAHALADTEATLRGLRVARVATLADVDTGADLARALRVTRTPARASSRAMSTMPSRAP